MNVPLFSAIFSIAFTVITGVLMVVIILLDKISGMSMIGATVVGTLIAVPVALVVSKKLSTIGKSSSQSNAT